MCEEERKISRRLKTSLEWIGRERNVLNGGCRGRWKNRRRRKYFVHNIVFAKASYNNYYLYCIAISECCFRPCIQCTYVYVDSTLLRRNKKKNCTYKYRSLFCCRPSLLHAAPCLTFRLPCSLSAVVGENAIFLLLCFSTIVLLWQLRIN